MANYHKMLIGMMILMICCNSCWGLKEKNLSLRVKFKSFYPFLSFVFDKTGSMQMNVSVNTDRIYRGDFNLLTFSLCTESQYRKLINNLEADPSAICTPDYSTKCELDLIKINDTRLQNYHVVQPNLYVFMVGNCQPDTRVFSISYTLLNNNGKSQLSVGDGPLPDVYISLMFVWGFFLLILFFEVFIRSRTYKIELHYLLALVLMLKMTVVASSLAYWRICAKTGYCYDGLLYLQSFLFAISESVFFSLLLLVAKGYKITRPNLPREEMRDVSVALVLLLSTLLFFSFYNPGYYLLSMMIMYFFMLPKIFTSITQNVYALKAQILMLEELQRAQQNREQNVATFRKKLRLFISLKTIIVVYLVAILLVSFVKMMLGLYSLDWLNSFINEIVSLFVVVSIFWMIRPQANLFSNDVDIFDQGWENNLDQLFVGMLEGDHREHIPEFHKPLDLSNTVVVHYPSNTGKTVASLAYKEGTPDPFKSEN